MDVKAYFSNNSIVYQEIFNEFLIHECSFEPFSNFWKIIWVEISKLKKSFNQLQNIEKIWGGVILCTINSLLCLNALVHWTQGKGFSPVWDLLCTTSSLLVLNALRHWSQGKGFSPLWFLLCNTRWGLCLNAFGHWWQGKGFSPVWVLLCTTSLPTSLNVLGHWSHWNGLSPVWVLLCTTSSLLV